MCDQMINSLLLKQSITDIKYYKQIVIFTIVLCVYYFNKQFFY